MKVKRLNYFLASEDERLLSVAIQASFPEVVFLDDKRWPSHEPLQQASIEQCKSGWVYIWNRGLFPSLPTKRVGNHLEGPGSFYVAQFERNKRKEGEIQAAQLSVSYDEQNKPHSEFSEKLHRLVKLQNSQALRLVESATGEVVTPRLTNFVVGANLADQLRQGLRLTIAFGRPTHLELAQT